jgi:hypothetical protein
MRTGPLGSTTSQHDLIDRRDRERAVIHPQPSTDSDIATSYRAPQGVWIHYLADLLLPAINAWRAEHGIEPAKPSEPPISLEEAKASADEYWARETLWAEQDKEELAAWKRAHRRVRSSARRPTLARVAKEANKLGLAVAHYEVKPDGSIVIVTGEPKPATESNPWLDDLKVTKQ